MKAKPIAHGGVELPSESYPEKQDFMHEKTIVDETQNRVIEASKSGFGRPVLVMLDGGDVKTRYKVNEPKKLMGRDLSCNIILSDTKCSRQHAEIQYLNFDDPKAPPKIVLKDLGSTNGTFVNGERIEEIELHDRDKIMVGATLLGLFFQDETTLKAEEDLIRMASTDPLTGLCNRGVFNMEIKREFDRARRYNRDLSLVLYDIDHFKRVNDNYGHPVGDLVLREMGVLSLESCRTNDLAARYGGEEFAILLPETTLENAIIQAERLRQLIMHHQFEANGQVLKITVSVGLAMINGGMKDSDALIEAADKALYEAKDAGRNQVCLGGLSGQPKPYSPENTILQFPPDLSA